MLYYRGNMNKDNMVWITWERQTRNQSMAAMLGVKCYELLSEKKGVHRYWACVKKTHNILKNQNVKVAFVQNPSIVLTAFAVLTKKIYNVQVVVDAHNSGVFPAEGKYPLLNFINRRLLKWSDLVIVTNENLGNRTGADYVVCTDPLPDINLDVQPIENDVLVVCSWADDEPIEEYIEASRNFPNLEFNFTGNHKKYSKTLKVPKNCRILGFVSEQQYYAYMAGAKLILDMTKRDNCLVCGAYEAIAMNKIVIVTDNYTNRVVFGSAVLYAQCESVSIAEAIENFFQQRHVMNVNLNEFRALYSYRCSKLVDEIHNRLLHFPIVN